MTQFTHKMSNPRYPEAATAAASGIRRGEERASPTHQLVLDAPMRKVHQTGPHEQMEDIADLSQCIAAHDRGDDHKHTPRSCAATLSTSADDNAASVTWAQTASDFVVELVKGDIVDLVGIIEKIGTTALQYFIADSSMVMTYLGPIVGGLLLTEELTLARQQRHNEIILSHPDMKSIVPLFPVPARAGAGERRSKARAVNSASLSLKPVSSEETSTCTEEVECTCTSCLRCSTTAKVASRC